MKETEDWEQISVKVSNIHIWERTVNPLKLLWSSSSDITKATARYLEEMAEVGVTVSHPTTSTPNTAQKHKPEIFNHKGKLSTYQNIKVKAAALKSHVRLCWRIRKVFLTVKLYNSSNHKWLLGRWSLQLLLGCFVCLVVVVLVWVFSPKKIKKSKYKL